MPDYCCAYNCRNCRSKATKAAKITFHKFPKDDQRRKEWTESLRRKDFQPSEASSLCSEHFTDDCFDRTGQTVRLRDTAIPSIYNFPGQFKVALCQKKKSISKKKCQSKTCGELVPIISPTIAHPFSLHFLQEHAYALTTDLDALKVRIMAAEATRDYKDKSLRNSKAREARLQVMCSKLCHKLRAHNLLTGRVRQQLDRIYSDHCYRVGNLV
ncbi:PREDICTED: THAP domain-containing protein 2-like isoform X1 [Priapulus caudatus]|uniref:THAP domain-containing protein 2-like isoform X1 n=1 Tax=Priapulus caudatus TaxID=37621 RepID=A0ABM1E581_PRICU|nr:PREDICTED: THAP domain-containing protein 2-like isoform X1 [Priapulus caudatus]